MKDYLPFSGNSFHTGIVITELSTAPYALQFKRGILIASLFLPYEVNDASKLEEVIPIVKKFFPGKKIYYDSRNLINITQSLIKKELYLR